MKFRPPSFKINAVPLLEGVRNFCIVLLAVFAGLYFARQLDLSGQRSGTEAAAKDIERELKTNLGEVRTAIDRNSARLKPLGNMARQVAEALREGKDKADIVNEIIQPGSAQFQLGFEWPVLQRAAWEAAVGGDRARWIDGKKLGRYGAAYAAQRDLSAQAWPAFGSVLDGPRLINALVDTQMGKVDPADTLHLINQYGAALNVVQGQLKQLETVLAAAVEPAKGEGKGEGKGDGHEDAKAEGHGDAAADKDKAHGEAKTAEHGEAKAEGHGEAAADKAGGHGDAKGGEHAPAKTEGHGDAAKEGHDEAAGGHGKAATKDEPPPLHEVPAKDGGGHGAKSGH